LSVRGARVFLGFVSLTLALAVVELLAPLVLPRRCGRGNPPLWRPTRDTGWSLVPNARGDVAVCDATREVARHHVVINAEGQRDRPRRRERTPGVTRVLVLGDSFVEGLQVDLAETFAARLEERLGVEMLNAGVSGDSTDNELRAFTTGGIGYRPDAVLLVLYVGNDVLENGARLYLRDSRGLPAKPWLRSTDASGRLAACLAVHRGAARLIETVPSALWQRSRVIRFGAVLGLNRTLELACAGAADPARLPGIPELLGVYQPPATPAWNEAWTATERALSDLARAVREARMAFGVALAPAGFEYDPSLRLHERIYPATRDVAWRYDYPYERLGAFLDREAIRWVTLRPALERHYRGTGRSGCYVWDGHWTPEGHAVVAEALAPFVTDLRPR
jgi:hypothetical protein